MHGQGTIRLTELNADVRSVKPGTEKVIWKGGFGKDRALGCGFGMGGSHMYKINGKYYILCPVGGTGGWQVCLRSDNIDGPYEHRIVMDDDRSYPGNGLHQGGMVQTVNGDWWFIIMQDRGAIGRVPCLVPVTWDNGWPMLGADGLDAIVYDKPAGHKGRVAPTVASDEFDGKHLGLQWQWNHNPDNNAWSLEKRRGYMRLEAGLADDLKNARNTLTQRVLGPISTATVEMDIAGLKNSCTAGFGIFEFPYTYVGVTQEDGNRRIVMCNDGKEIASEPISGFASLSQTTVLQRISSMLLTGTTSSLSGTNWRWALGCLGLPTVLLCSTLPLNRRVSADMPISIGSAWQVPETQKSHPSEFIPVSAGCGGLQKCLWKVYAWQMALRRAIETKIWRYRYK